jgi:hypothetical protein
MMEWKPATGPFASGEVLYLGKWPVGSVNWVSGSKGETKNYGAFSKLPGLKQLLDKFEKEEDAKARVEKATRYWLSKLDAAPQIDKGG